MGVVRPRVNTSYLIDIEYIERVKNTIADARKQCEQGNCVDDALLWEMVKLKVRETSILFSVLRKWQLEKNSGKELKDKLTSLERKSEEMLSYSGKDEEQGETRTRKSSSIQNGRVYFKTKSYKV